MSRSVNTQDTEQKSLSIYFVYRTLHPSHMFSIYLYKSTLSSARAAGARKAALNAVVRFLDEQGEAIEIQFGSRNWFVVL